MNQTRKTITTLSLLIVFLTLGFFIVLGLFTAGWLYTYKTFTAKTPVARLEVSGQMQDDLGPYTDVELSFYKSQSALTSLFVGTSEPAEIGESMQYRLYGDEISIDGPTIKLKDGVLLLNFDNIYKVVRLRAEYSNPDLEGNRLTETMPRRYDLAGGVDSWRNFDKTFRSSTPLGWFYRLFVDSSTIQSSGIFVPEEDTTYILYVTTNGFRFE